ncbi:hypothetical protein KH5_04530 [Urechidicola sp. KH5]
MKLYRIVLAIVLMACSMEVYPQSEEGANTIPYFTFYKLNKEPFVRDSISNSLKKLFFYFNSECNHCQKQAKWLSRRMNSNPELYKNLQMIFVSFEEMNAIAAFKEKYNFNKNNCIFLQDSRVTFDDKFEVNSAPSILIFSKDNKLIKKFEGEVKMNILLPYID